jgi:hypothetical protein
MGGIQLRTRSVTAPPVGAGKCALTNSVMETRGCDPAPPVSCPITLPPSPPPTPMSVTPAAPIGPTQPAGTPAPGDSAAPSDTAFTFSASAATRSSFSFSSDVTAKAVNVDDPGAMAVFSFAPSTNAVGVSGAAASVAGETRFPFAVQLQFTSRYVLKTLTLSGFDSVADRVEVSCSNRNERRRADAVVVPVTSSTPDLSTQTAAGFDTFEVRCTDRLSSFGIRSFVATPKSSETTGDDEGGLGSVGIALIVVGVIVFVAAVGVVLFVLYRRKTQGDSPKPVHQPVEEVFKSPMQPQEAGGIYQGVSLTLAQKQATGVYGPMAMTSEPQEQYQPMAITPSSRETNVLDIGTYGSVGTVSSASVGTYQGGMQTASESGASTGMYLKW